MCFDRNKHVYLNYSDFTSSYEPFSQVLKSFDYVLSGSKGKITWRRKMQTKQQLKRCTRNVHRSFSDFRPRLGVNFHILLTQNWLWESSLSLLSPWCILFRIKLGLFRKKLKPEEAFTTKKWIVLTEHLLAQAHNHMIMIYESLTLHCCGSKFVVSCWGCL